jgi:hypothetical protein
LNRALSSAAQAPPHEATTGQIGIDSSGAPLYINAMSLRSRRPSSGKSKAALRRWTAVLIRKQGRSLGVVEAANIEAAEIAAAKMFNLSENQRRRLIMREHI